MLKYCLRENLLTPAPDDYMAQAADVRSYTLDEIIDLMMEKGTTLTRAARGKIEDKHEDCSF